MNAIVLPTNNTKNHIYLVPAVWNYNVKFPEHCGLTMSEIILLSLIILVIRINSLCIYWMPIKYPGIILEEYHYRQD